MAQVDDTRKIWMATASNESAVTTLDSDFTTYQSATAPYLVPTGAVIDFAGTSEPTGWLFCYGQAVSRTTYAALFTAISTTYGVGDGSTTFNLPDCRGRVTAGQDDMGGSSADRLTDQSGGLDGDTLGDTGGAETHTLTTAQLASHSHTSGTLTSSQADWCRNPGTNNNNQAGGGGNIVNTVTEDAITMTGSTATAGSGSAHNNVQPTIILNKIIKT